MENTNIVVAVSGGFDTVHVGHLRLMQEAKALGHKLVVIVNNDNWLMSKKGYVFMPQEERVEILRGFTCVDEVVLTKHGINDADRSVASSLREIRPHIFANGGDRTAQNTPEDVVCAELGITQVYGVGSGGKVQSSSWMVDHAIKALTRSVRPWGHFHAYARGEGWYLKTITVNPGERLSLQYHRHREEYWMLVEGDAIATLNGAETALKKGEVFRIPVIAQHRLASAGPTGATIVEIALGDFDENDIVRLEDDYARAQK